MSSPGLLHAWSMDRPSAGDAAAVVDFNTWAVNTILHIRAGINYEAYSLSVIPLSETRLRDEGIKPLYVFARGIFNTLRASAREENVAVPDVPDVPEDWTEEASVDSEALAAGIFPHLAESVKPIAEWIFGPRDQNSGVHWSSRVAVTSVVPDTVIRGVLAVGGAAGGSEWKSFVAQVTGSEFKRIAGVIDEEILRIRAQPGSGWNEEEAKRVVIEQFGNLKDSIKAGT